MNLPLLSATKPTGAQFVLSASQIGRYDECKRKWAFEYIAGLREPPHPSAFLGTLVHAHLENWLRDGIPPGARPLLTRDGKPLQGTKEQHAKSIKIAQRMIRYLPPPGVATVERNFYLSTTYQPANSQYAEEHHYTGFIDFSFDGRLYQVEDFPVPVIGDHKTTSNLDYAKTEADLHNDLQGVLYALAGFLGFNTEDLLLFWNYGTTKDRDAQVHPVRTRVSLPVVLEKFERVIEPVASEIIAHRRAANDPHSFPPTLSACSAYGGCPHRQRCNVSDQERMVFDMTQGSGFGSDSMADRMAAYPDPGNGAQAGQPQFAPPPAQFAPAPPGQPQFAPAQPQPYIAPAPGAGGTFDPATMAKLRELGYTFPPSAHPLVTPVPQQQTFVPPNPVPQQMFETSGNIAPALPVPQAAPQGFAPPFVQPAPAQAAPQFPLPPTATPGAPQQSLPFQPPAGASLGLPVAPAALQPPLPPYSPEQGPNPPEAGRALTAAPLLAPRAPSASGAPGVETSVEPGKRRGRPAGSPNKEPTREQLVFLEGAKAAMTSINFNGTVDQVLAGGELMLAAFKKKFDKE